MKTTHIRDDGSYILPNGIEIEIEKFSSKNEKKVFVYLPDKMYVYVDHMRLKVGNEDKVIVEKFRKQY